LLAAWAVLSSCLSCVSLAAPSYSRQLAFRRTMGSEGSIRRKVNSHRFSLDNHASHRAQIATHGPSLEASRYKKINEAQDIQEGNGSPQPSAISRALQFVGTILSGKTAWGERYDEKNQGQKLSSMSRTVEFEGDEKAKFQSGGRAVNRRVNFATAIRNRKPEVYLNTVSDGHFEKGEAHLLRKAMADSGIERREHPPAAADSKNGADAESATTAMVAREVASCGGEAPNEKGGVVCFLDLDMTSFWGNDLNDLGCALQWMQRPFADILHLYRMLFNEEAARTLSAVKKKYATKVVIYTRRPSLLYYSSCFRPDKLITLRFCEEWHHDEVVLVNNEALDMRQIVLPGHIKGSQEVMHHLIPSEPMLEKEKYDLQMCFERLFAARAVMQEKLGLQEPPEVVVCATPKDVPATARRMGLQDARCFLWDDNERLLGHDGVYVVDRFDALPAKTLSSLELFLDKCLPLHEIPDDLATFMAGAPEDHRVLDIVEDEDGDDVLVYTLQQRERGRPEKGWPLPDLPGVTHDGPLAGGVKVLRQLSADFLKKTKEVITRTDSATTGFGTMIRVPSQLKGGLSLSA